MDKHNDWSELTVQLQPLARRLYEAMSLREWDQAAMLSSELCDTAHALYKESIKQQAKVACT